MKLRILATALVLAAVTSAPASAMVSKQSLNSAVQSAVSGGTLSAVVNGDTVTLFGNVEGTYDANQAKRAALNVEGVNKVINHLTTSR